MRRRPRRCKRDSRPTWGRPFRSPAQRGWEIEVQVQQLPDAIVAPHLPIDMLHLRLGLAHAQVKLSSKWGSTIVLSGASAAGG
eukprot:10076826-Alexandrium_andersonii.AAC.1